MGPGEGYLDRFRPLDLNPNPSKASLTKLPDVAEFCFFSRIFFTGVAEFFKKGSELVDLTEF